MKKIVYTVKMDTNWDPDFIAVYDSIKTVAQGLHDIFMEEDIYIDENDIAKQIREREKDGCCYLFFAEEFSDYVKEHPDRFSYIVQAVEMNTYC